MISGLPGGSRKAISELPEPTGTDHLTATCRFQKYVYEYCNHIQDRMKIPSYYEFVIYNMVYLPLAFG